MTRVTRYEAPYFFKKNHEIQFSINQILNDKIKKKFNYTKGFKK